MSILPDTETAQRAKQQKEQTEKVARIIALILAGISVFLFFFKLLFF